MPEVVKLARGTLQQHNTFKGEIGEVTLISDGSANEFPTGEIRIHDSITFGGKGPILKLNLNSPTVLNANGTINVLEDRNGVPTLSNTTISNTTTFEDKFPMPATVAFPSGHIIGMTVETFRTLGVETITNLVTNPQTKGLTQSGWETFNSNIPDISLAVRTDNPILALESNFVMGEPENYNPYVVFKWMYQLNGTSGTWLDFDLQDTVGTYGAMNCHFFFGGHGSTSSQTVPERRVKNVYCIIKDQITANRGDVVTFRCFKYSILSQGKFYLNRSEKVFDSGFHFYGGTNTSGYKLYEIAK